MSDHYDALETRDPTARERALMQALPAQIAHAKSGTDWYARSLADIDPASVTSREALAALPVTRKHSLIEAQKAAPPLAGLNALALGDAAVAFTSPGPIFEVMGTRADYYGGARSLHAAGLRKGDIVQNSFSYHLTPGGWIFHDSARALGCPVIPAGIGNTEQQAQVMAQYRPKGHAGTPDYLKAILEKGDELGLDISSVKCAIVGAGPLFPPLRVWYGERGIHVFNTFGTAELGIVAYETSAQNGMVIAEDKIAEVVVPGTGEPVANIGDVGELVVTLLSPEVPLIRFATGDLTALTDASSPCGRTNVRMLGWMGRADQTTKVRGMFVHPEQIADIVKRHPEIPKARLVVDAVDGKDAPHLRIEAASADPALAEAAAQSFQTVCKLRATVEIVEPGALPNDGKVIEDVRVYE